MVADGSLGAVLTSLSGPTLEFLLEWYVGDPKATRSGKPENNIISSSNNNMISSSNNNISSNNTISSSGIILMIIITRDPLIAAYSAVRCSTS